MERPIALQLIHMHQYLIWPLQRLPPPFWSSFNLEWVVRELSWQFQQQTLTSRFMSLLSPTNLAFTNSTTHSAEYRTQFPKSSTLPPLPLLHVLRGQENPALVGSRNLKNRGLQTSLQKGASDVELGWQLWSVLESRKRAAGDEVVLLGSVFFWIHNFYTY